MPNNNVYVHGELLGAPSIWIRCNDLTARSQKDLQILGVIFRFLQIYYANTPYVWLNDIHVYRAFKTHSRRCVMKSSRVGGNIMSNVAFRNEEIRWWCDRHAGGNLETFGVPKVIWVLDMAIDVYFTWFSWMVFLKLEDVCL